MSEKHILRFALSKTGLIVLAVNCFAFGAFVMRIMLGADRPSDIFLAVGPGLVTIAGFTAIYIAVHGRGV